MNDMDPNPFPDEGGPRGLPGAGMTCREFAEAWDELLDARSAPMPGLERAIEAHAGSCEPCRATSARYQALRQAMAAWPPIPAASAGSMARLRALSVPGRPRVGPVARALRWSSIPMAAAALLLIVRVVGLVPAAPGPAKARIEPPTIGRPLGEALAEATEATIDLARRTSEPAARIGREVLEMEAHALASRDPAAPTEEGREEDPGSSGFFRSVGERVNAGVAPLSGSARHAFGFLLPAPPEPGPADARDGL